MFASECTECWIELERCKRLVEAWQWVLEIVDKIAEEETSNMDSNGF